MRTRLKRLNLAVARRAVRFLLLAGMLVQSSVGSLVITIYHDQAIFIGSDSLAVSMATGERVQSVQKIFRVSSNACAAITGFAVLKLGGLPGRPAYSLNIVDALEKLCEREADAPVSTEAKIALIASDLNLRCKFFFDDPAIKIPAGNDAGKTRIQFAGYDPDQKRFFVKSFIPGVADAPQFDIAYEFGGKKEKAGSFPLSFQGEARFLSELMSHHAGLWSLVSSDFAKTIDRLNSPRKVPDYMIKNCMLEMFYLHRQNAARYDLDKGLIGPPYHVFKITRDKVIPLTLDPAASGTPQKLK